MEAADDASGIALVEAPGVVGEVRRIARRIKSLLLEGVRPEQIILTARDLTHYADLASGVFDDYGVPVDVEGDEPLTRNTAVSVLFRAVRLAEDDWPFAGVTALLRNSFFQPAWQEVCGRSAMPLRAEALLRLLGETRGRDSYVTAAARWAREQQPGLEDEQAEESRRLRTHELARECVSFLTRFFHSWDDAPETAKAEEHVEWLERFAPDLGVVTAADSPRDQSAVGRLFDEVRRWARRGAGADDASVLDRRTFHRRLLALAAAAGLPRSSGGSDRIRVLPAVAARHLEADYVFVLGLGERGFPRLTTPPSLLDDDDRQELSQKGLVLLR